MPSVPQAADILASLGQASFIWEIGSDRLTWSENAPSVFAEEMSSTFKAMDDALNISYDRFIRTVEPDHYAASQALWQAMEANGDVNESNNVGVWGSIIANQVFIANNAVDHYVPFGTPVPGQPAQSGYSETLTFPQNSFSG